jgi:hypothetical protein
MHARPTAPPFDVLVVEGDTSPYSSSGFQDELVRAVLLGLLFEGVAFLCFDTFGLSRATRQLERLRDNLEAPSVSAMPSLNRHAHRL